MKAEILETAKKLLPEGFREDLLAVRAADVEEYIRSYCGTAEIPVGCELLAARMVAAAADGSIGDRALKSVTRGDFSAAYEMGSRAGLEDFDRRLNRFRRLRWSGQ